MKGLILELTDSEQNSDLSLTPVTNVTGNASDGPCSSMNPGNLFDSSLNPMTSPVPPSTVMDPSLSSFHGMSRDLSEMVDLTGSPGFLHGLPSSSSPGSMLLSGPSGMFMSSAHSPHTDLMMTMTNPTTPLDIMDPLGMGDMIATGAETPELPTLTWDTTPPVSQPEFFQAIEMYSNPGYNGQTLGSMSSKMVIDSDEMGLGVSSLEAVTADESGYVINTTMTMAQTIGTLTDLPSIPSLGSSIGIQTDEYAMDTTTGGTESADKIDDQPTPDLTMLPSLPPPEATPPGPTPPCPVSQQAVMFMSPGDGESSLDSPANQQEEEEEESEEKQETQHQTRQRDQPGSSMLFPSLKNYLAQQQMQTEGWAAACPAPVHEDVFYSLVKPRVLTSTTTRVLKKPFYTADKTFEDSLLVSPLECFLGSVYLMHRLTQTLLELGVPVSLSSLLLTSLTDLSRFNVSSY